MEPAVRASLPLRFVNLAVLVFYTRVPLVVLDGPLKESLAALAGEQPVVVPRHLISAHRTQLLQVLVIGVIHHFKLRHWEEEK